MRLLLNERPVELAEDELPVAGLVARFRPGADVLVLNGHPAPPEAVVRDGDALVLFRRGETPTPEELDALLDARHGPGVAEKLRRAVVGVAGLGGLGSNVAVALARVGVGRLVLADFDVVEPTNVNRQHYFLDQLGLPKTEALARTLRRIRPQIDLELHPCRLDEDSVLSVFRDCHLVVEAFDDAEAKIMLCESLQANRPELPLVVGSGMAGYESSNTVRTRRAGTLYVCGDETSEARPGTGLMAPRVGVCAHHQANMALRILLGEDDA